MDIHQAASSLAEKLGRPSWLSCIGVKLNAKEIVVYSVFSKEEAMRHIPFLDWEGFPIKIVEMASFAPLGGIQ